MKVTRYPWRDNPKPVEPGRLVIAVGDVHGRLDLLDVLFDALSEDVAGIEPKLAECVLLGDLVDRGPESRGVLELARQGLRSRFPGPPVHDTVLLGNHDAWLRMALENVLGQADLDLWRRNGGEATWRSLGIETATRPEVLAAGIRDALPEAVRDLVLTAPLSHRVGDLLFVHAGIDPRLALDRQPAEVTLWIRDAFLYPRQWPHPVLVVHGHTITPHTGEPGVHFFRIGIDTGAYASGVLTAVEFLEDRLRFVQASVR
jgi:serine/threonine protein phosphatase 1